MANLISSYVKKLKDGAVNQVVDDLIIAKGSEERVSQREYNEAVDALFKCGINITIDALYKELKDSTRGERCQMRLK